MRLIGSVCLRGEGKFLISLIGLVMSGTLKSSSTRNSSSSGTSQSSIVSCLKIRGLDY